MIPTPPTPTPWWNDPRGVAPPLPRYSFSPISQILLGTSRSLRALPLESVLPLLTLGGRRSMRSPSSGGESEPPWCECSSDEELALLALLAGESDGGLCTMSCRKDGRSGAGACTESGVCVCAREGAAGVVCPGVAACSPPARLRPGKLKAPGWGPVEYRGEGGRRSCCC